ncbi:hypothetical protein BDQ17DRAFT_1383359 [Cyathus striatus]|nr:hypothetical protein BDQ17DRAFT_1383359 [Cyathus striatus]
MFHIIIEVIDITDIPGNCQKYTGIGSRTATYTLTINVDGKTMLTYDFHKKKNAPKKLPAERDNDDKNSSYELAKTFACEISSRSKLNFIVDCKRTQWHDPHNISTTIVQCNKLQFNSETTVHLEYEVKSKMKKGKLTLKASRVSSSTELIQFKIPIRAKKLLYNASDLEGLGIVSQILKSEEGLSSLRSCPEWVNFLGSMGNLVKIAVPIAKIDPYAMLALSVARVAFEIFIKQKERDERVLGLIQIIADVYQMILDSDPVMKCRTLSEAINNLIALTRECAYFIVQYIKPVPFVERTVINTLSNNNEIITQFEKHFFALKEVFFTGVMLSIAQMNVKILGKLEGIDSKLDHMFMLSFPLLGRSWSKLDGCLEGTQMPLLSKIYEWGTSPSDDVPNIFLLLGTSKNSSGKTAVSHTVANYFFECERLGATIFFDTKASSSSENFFLSIIRELSEYHPEIRKKVMMGMKTSNVKLVNDPLDRQFHFLVSQVLKSLTLVGPTLIIIDGLDKCVDRDILLKLLSNFPSNIRLLITSGPADDIKAAFPAGPCIRHKMTSIEDDDMQRNLKFIRKTRVSLRRIWSSFEIHKRHKIYSY